MKIKISLVLLFIFSYFHAQEITDQNAFKKCIKTFSKKICITDNDKDKLLFYRDKCPDETGPAENEGCPLKDTDHDGLIDKYDVCVTVFGPQENNGCPWPDTDLDGILDHQDSCPTVWGPKTNNGCPICNKK